MELKCVKIFLFLNLFPGHFFIDFGLEFRGLGLKDRCFRMDGIAKKEFSWNSFKKKIGVEFKCLFNASGTVFLVF